VKAKQHILSQFPDVEISEHMDMLAVKTQPEQLIDLAIWLRDNPKLKFELLTDACGVDFLHYGKAQWQTDQATSGGFSRAADKISENTEHGRFAMVYHLLSIEHHMRVRVITDLAGLPIVHTLVGIWPNVEWYEREAYDLYGILFEKHPDLRRILTDYGFSGHPLRKDFPLIGEVAIRYDAQKQSCVYEPVDIIEKVNIPKVIRHDARFDERAEGESS
jgi:NADH-quinone oxidoreductase subunit C